MAFTLNILPAQLPFFNGFQYGGYLRFQITGSQHHIISRFQCLQTDTSIPRHPFHGKRICEYQPSKSQFVRQQIIHHIAGQ